jgi:hypothetical protein
MGVSVLARTVLCIAALAAGCDLAGEWIGFNFMDYDNQTSYSLQIAQSSPAAITAACAGEFCAWSHAAGSVAGAMVTLLTDTKVSIEGLVHRSCDIITTGIPEQRAMNWLRVNRNITRVHVVFMTHLDVGYTLDTSMDVIEQYRTQWFPKAFATAAALPDTFKWTTHPWLLLEILNNATGTVTNDDIK